MAIELKHSVDVINLKGGGGNMVQVSRTHKFNYRQVIARSTMHSLQYIGKRKFIALNYLWQVIRFSLGLRNEIGICSLFKTKQQKHGAQILIEKDYEIE